MENNVNFGHILTNLETFTVETSRTKNKVLKLLLVQKLQREQPQLFLKSKCPSLISSIYMGKAF